MRTLQDYQKFLRRILTLICEQTRIESKVPLHEILENPRLVVILNHSTPISWIPAISLLATEAAVCGGEDRIPVGIVDKFFYSNPLTKMVAEYVSQSQVPLGFDELVEMFSEGEKKDLILFPEGARTFFGDLQKIQNFRSPRFVEIAILTETPILLAVHRGSESWNMELPVPKEWGAFLSPISSFFGRGLFETGSINLPFLLKKIPEFRMHLELWPLGLKKEDLSSDLEVRRVQIQQQADQIRERMQELYDHL